MNSYINERTQPCPIPLKKLSSFESKSELSVNHAVIDPSKMSPPNNFMETLMKRMDNYYSPTSNKKFEFTSEKNSILQMNPFLYQLNPNKVILLII